MNKIAIIIKSAAADLPGVKQDEIHFDEFLKSPYGGEWEDSEICTLHTPIWGKGKADELSSDINGIRHKQYDYALVLYSGHGGLDLQGNLRIYPDCKVDVDASILCNIAPKQLTIFDCCRAFDKEAEMIKEAVTAGRVYPATTRAFYEEQIRRALPQQNYLFACSMEECAMDTSKGAVYLNALFKAGRAFSNNGEWKSVREAHMEATDAVLANPFNQQHPDFILPKCSKELSLPFSVNPHNLNVALHRCSY